MGFMIPIAEHFAAYHVETNCGTEIVPEEVCGTLDAGDGENAMFSPFESVENLAALEPYLEGSRVESVERKVGWYARLSAPGYLDCTSWGGPYATEREALDAVKEFYECDDNGDDNEEASGT